MERSNQKSDIFSVGVVVLAAGYSSRMHSFKPLLPLGEGAVIDTVLKSISFANDILEDESVGAKIEKTTVVTGYNHKELEAYISSPVCTVYNEKFADGMFTSIQAGLVDMKKGNQNESGENRQGRENLDGCFIIPVDCPLCGGEALAKMISILMKKEKPKESDEFAVPTFMGKKGHPLFVPELYFDEIIKYEGVGGLKGITDKYFEKMLRIPVDFEGVVLDMDNRASYESLIEFYDDWKSGKNSLQVSLKELAKGRRIVLIRHGQIRQHKEKIFLGKIDEPLSEEGRTQAKEAGKELLALEKEGFDIKNIYTSPLKRAKETAEIIAETCNEFVESVTEMKDISEMSLGSWDGKYISEIKKKYPKEYELRGRNIFAFKIGNGSENFYDVQYRVVNAVKEVLRKDSSRDIAIVAHKGVLRALENNLRGKSVEDPWKEMKNCQIRVIDGE